MEARRYEGAAIAVALALSCAAPAGVAHADQLVRTYAQGEAVPHELVLDGEQYSLTGWEPGGGYVAGTRLFEKTLKITVTADDYGGDPKAFFAASVAVDEDGYIGRIPLSSASSRVTQTRPERVDYEESVDFEFIGKAELDTLPSTRNAVVAGREVTLSKLDVQAGRQPSDPGIEVYSGRAIYGIHEQEDVAIEYELTAVYSGELSREASPSTLVASYDLAAQNPVGLTKGDDSAFGSDSAGSKASETFAEDNADGRAAETAIYIPIWAIAVPTALALACCAALAWIASRGMRSSGPSRDADTRDEQSSASPEERRSGEDEGSNVRTAVQDAPDVEAQMAHAEGDGGDGELSEPQGEAAGEQAEGRRSAARPGGARRRRRR